MKALVALIALVLIPCARAELREPPTRQVIGGDLIYRATAIAPTEPRAVFFAEARAARMLSIECGAPPRGTRVYQQLTERMSDGSYRTVVEEGTAIADCEEVRRASPRALKRGLGHLQLLDAITSYEKMTMENPAPTAPRAVAAPVTMIFTDEQQISHLRAIDAKADARLRERARIAARAQ
ncbi:MAG: hypothetical protein ACXWP5_08580 [Bdellovibrionota bacterium]